MHKVNAMKRKHSKRKETKAEGRSEEGALGAQGGKAAGEPPTKESPKADAGGAGKGSSRTTKAGYRPLGSASPSSPSSSSPFVWVSVMVLLVAALIGAWIAFPGLLSSGDADGATSTEWSLARCVQADVELPVIEGWPGTSGGSLYVAVKNQRSLVRRQGRPAIKDHQSSHADGDEEDDENGGGPVPVVLRRTAMVDRWPALTRWKSPDYLASRPVRFIHQ